MSWSESEACFTLIFMSIFVSSLTSRMLQLQQLMDRESGREMACAISLHVTHIFVYTCLCGMPMTYETWTRSACIACRLQAPASKIPRDAGNSMKSTGNSGCKPSAWLDVIRDESRKECDESCASFRPKLATTKSFIQVAQNMSKLLALNGAVGSSIPNP